MNLSKSNQDSWILNLRKVVIYLALLIPLSLFYSCSDDNDSLPEPPPELPYTSPASVKVGSDVTNVPSAGVISAQFTDAPAGSDIGKIVDNDTNTKFVTTHDTFYILWEGDENVAVNYYTLTSANDAPEKDPKSWILYGSSDGKTWVRINQQRDQVFSKRQEEKKYQCENTTAYRYYKLEIQGNNGASDTQIAELILKKVAISIKYWDINMPTAGTLTPEFADFPQGTELGYIIDNNASTKFIMPRSNFYIMWSGAQKAIAKHYTLTSADNSPEKDPKSWILYGSDNSEEWTPIDAQQDQVFAERKEKKEYHLSNQTEYRYYKLEIKDNKGGASTQIAEWNLHGYIDCKDLEARNNGQTFSSLTPMGKHFENRPETTDEIRTWLSTAENEPTITDNPLLYWKEFDVTLYPFGKPLPADINQRAIGDCCAVAALGSMAYMHPDYIQSIIKDNGNKTYTISMFDPKGEPIDVAITAKFLTDEHHNSITSCGKALVLNWGTVLEKAVMKYRHVYWKNYNLGGIPQQEVTPLFVGNGYVFCFSAGALNNEDLTRMVRAGLAQGYFVTGGFNQANSIGNQGTVTGHCFSGMYSADPNALFSMRNPWGGDGEKDGVLNIPNNNIIPPTTDVMIMHPGKALENRYGMFEPYIPPRW